MDPILVHDSKLILDELGLTDSEAIARFYRKMVKEGNIDFLDQ